MARYINHTKSTVKKTIGAYDDISNFGFATEQMPEKLDWVVISDNYQAAVGDAIAIEASNGPFTITLPASPVAGDRVSLMEYSGYMDGNNITIDRNGENILGIAQNSTLNDIELSMSFVYVNSTYGWTIT